MWGEAWLGTAPCYLEKMPMQVGWLGTGAVSSRPPSWTTAGCDLVIHPKNPQFLYSSELAGLVALTFPALTWATGDLSIYALALLLALTGHEVYMQILLLLHPFWPS